MVEPLSLTLSIERRHPSHIRPCLPLVHREEILSKEMYLWRRRCSPSGSPLGMRRKAWISAGLAQRAHPRSPHPLSMHSNIMFPVACEFVVLWNEANPEGYKIRSLTGSKAFTTLIDATVSSRFAYVRACRSHGYGPCNLRTIANVLCIKSHRSKVSTDANLLRTMSLILLFYLVTT